jgi:hypothetical protein
MYLTSNRHFTLICWTFEYSAAISELSTGFLWKRAGLVRRKGSLTISVILDGSRDRVPSGFIP